MHEHHAMAFPPFRSRPDVRRRFAKQLPKLLGMTMEQVQAEVPYYRHLHPDQIDQEITEVTRQNLQLFVRLLQSGRLPEPSEIEFMMRSAANRAEERIPLPEVLAAYYAGFSACWRQLDDVVESGDVTAVVEIGSLVLAYLQVVTTAVTETYVETTSALAGREQEAREELLKRVLNATDTPEHWYDAGLDHWPECSVISLRHRSPRHDDTVTVAVEVRRRTRAIREALGALSGDVVLDDLSPTGGMVVLRGRVEPAALRTALGKVIRGKWHAGLAVSTDRENTPEAAQSAHDCAEVAYRLGHPSGVHQINDLLLEVQVTRPGPARTALCELLSPVAGNSELMDTLTTYVDESHRRAQTAERLHVHPNTLDYRLRRVRELTGLDPNEPEGRQLIRAALVARRFIDGAGTRRGQRL